MSEKPRRWFQIHLSTAIVLMFVAGGLLGLNFRAPQILEVEFFQEEGGLSRVTFNGDGWPVRAVERRIETSGNEPEELEALKSAIIAGNELGCDSRWRPAGWLLINHRLINAIICFGIVAGTAAFCESRIRRREARKP